MKTVYDMTLLDTLPENMRTVDNIAFSYAFRRALDKVCSKMQYLSCYADIDKMPENLCDYMAAELDALYYDKSLSISAKREIIKNAVKLHDISGTFKAVKIIVNAVLASGEVKEWCDDDFDEQGQGKPYLFDIRTDIPLNKESIEMLERIIYKVKPARSVLRKIGVSHNKNFEMFVGAYADVLRLNHIFFDREV